MNSVVERIDRAVRLYKKTGARVHAHPLMGRLLVELDGRISASRRSMNRLGVVPICKICEEEEGGSCCGAGIEKRYGTELLFINLMLGVKLHRQPPPPESCHFLSSGGCLLRARHVLCVNYLCPRLRQALGHERLLALQETTGRELDCLFRFHETLKKVLEPERWK